MGRHQASCSALPKPKDKAAAGTEESYNESLGGEKKIVAIPDLSKKKKKVFKVSFEGNGRPLKGLSREWRGVQIKVKFRFDPKISLMSWLSS